MKKAILLSALVFCGAMAQSQKTLSNDSIIKLVKAGMDEDLITGVIASQPSDFALGTDDLIALKSAGVSQKVISAMVSKGSGSSPSSAQQSATATSASVGKEGAGVGVHEIGVYYKLGGNWQEMEPEVINFKTGGVLKSIGSYGIVKGDINGHIKGAQSKTALKTPVEITIYTPEGVGASEYQLLHLHSQSDSREFRTVTGGVFHKSGGAARDAIEFEGKKVASRTYTLTLNLSSGEYGILPPSSGDATGSSGRIGKIYSFQIIE